MKIRQESENIMPKKNETASTSTKVSSFDLSTAPIYGTGLKVVRQGNLLIMVVDMDHEGYITQGQLKKQADGSVKQKGGGNIMHGTSHGVSKMVNSEGKEINVNVNVYSKAPVV